MTPSQPLPSSLYAHATAGWLVGWQLGILHALCVKHSPLSSSIKTFPLSPFSQPSLTHSMGRSRMWVRVDGEDGRGRRSVKECRDPGSPSLEAGERAILDNVICSIASSHGDGDRLASCMALRHVSDSSIKVKTHININVLNKSGSRNHPPLRWSFFQWSVRWSPFLCAPGLGESII